MHPRRIRACPRGRYRTIRNPAPGNGGNAPGAKRGEPVRRRARPMNMDRRQRHRLPRCPHCDGKLQRSSRTRTRIIEDIPESITPVVTEHTIHRDYCPQCKKHVEPVVPRAKTVVTTTFSGSRSRTARRKQVRVGRVRQRIKEYTSTAGDGIRTHDVQLGKLAFYH